LTRLTPHLLNVIAKLTWVLYRRRVWIACRNRLARLRVRVIVLGFRWGRSHAGCYYVLLATQTGCSRADTRLRESWPLISRNTRRRLRSRCILRPQAQTTRLEACAKALASRIQMRMSTEPIGRNARKATISFERVPTGRLVPIA
jgi:hypothetical protein